MNQNVTEIDQKVCRCHVQRSSPNIQCWPNINMFWQCLEYQNPADLGRESRHWQVSYCHDDLVIGLKIPVWLEK